MRISDWSSDVCSSDLVRAPGGACHQRGCSEYARADDNADRDRDDIADTKGGTRLSGSCFACALQWFKSAHAVSARRMDCGDVIRAPLSTEQRKGLGGAGEQRSCTCPSRPQ